VGLLIWHPLSQAGHSHAKAREPVLIIIDYQAVDHRRRPHDRGSRLLVLPRWG